MLDSIDHIVINAVHSSLNIDNSRLLGMLEFQNPFVLCVS